MKKFILYVPLFVVLFCCKTVDEVEIPHEPILLETKPPTDVSAKKITLRGEVKKFNHEKIIDIGFIVYTNSEKAPAPIEFSVGSDSTVAGDVSYSYVPESPLQPLATFQYTIYVRTEKGFYQGELEYVLIDDLDIEESQEEKASLGQNILVRGNFSTLDEGFKILSRAQNLPYVLNDDKTLLTVTLPEKGYHHGDFIEIILQWRHKDVRHPFQRVIKQIEIVAQINPLQNYTYGLSENIVLTGKGLPAYGHDGLYLLIGDQTIPYQNPLVLRTVELLKGDSFRIGYYNGVDSIYFDKPLMLKHPSSDLAHFNTNVLHPGEVLTVTELSKYQYFNNKIERLTLGKHEVRILYDDHNIMRIGVDDVPEGIYPLHIESPYYTYTTTQKVEVKKFHWTAPNDLSAHYDDTVTLRGSFLDSKHYIVKFRGEKEISFWHESKSGKLDMKISTDLPPGQYSFTVDYHDNVQNSNQTSRKLTVEKPFIQDISPKMGYPGDMITIKGKGIQKANRYYINRQWVYVMNQKNGDVQFMIPGFMLPGKVDILAEFTDFTIRANQLLEIK